MAASHRQKRPDLLHHVRVLAEGIGPRPGTSPAERQAHEYAAALLERWGAVTQTEPFRSAGTFTWPWLLVAGLLVAAGALTWWPALRWVGAMSGLVGAFLFVSMADVALEVGRLFPQGQSQNVVGRLAPRGPARRRVVLVAHADSTRAALIFSPGQAQRFGQNFRLNTVASLWLAAVALAAALYPIALPWPWLAAPALVPVAWGGLALVHRELFMPWVQGANDNASGVAVALGLAEYYATNPLAQTELWCVITGCEEVGAPAGMARFLGRHGRELRDADFLILDNFGAGDLRYLTGEGNLRFHRADPGLLELAARVAAAHPGWQAGPSRVPAGSYTDAHPALAAGYRALAVWAERGGVIPNWHWPSDVLANVEPAALDRAFDFTRELIEALDRVG